MATASSSRAPDLESPQAQETTPLLQTESSSRPATIVAVAPPHDEDPEAGPSTPGPATPGTASNPALGVTPRLDRWIVIHLLSTLAIGTVGYVFMIISMVLCAQGGDLYAYWFSSWDDTRYLLLLVIAPLIFIIVNILWFRRYNRFIPAFTNILVFAVAAFFVFNETGIFVISYSYELITFEDFCEDFRDKREYMYPGTYGGCKVWLVWYQVTCWFFMVLFSILTLAFVAVPIMFLVRVYKNRTWPALSSSQSNGSRGWTLPAGFFSVEVAFRWGQPPTAPREEVRPADSPREGEERGPGLEAETEVETEPGTSPRSRGKATEQNSASRS